MFDSPIRLLALATIVAAVTGLAPVSAAQAEFEPTLSPWGGIYVGIQGGYGLGNTDTTEDPGNAVAYNGAGNNWNTDTDGYLAGLHVGLNWESYALVMGIEASLGYLSVEGEAADPGSGGKDTLAVTGAGTYADVVARIGFAPGNMLYYMKGGVAFADLDLSVVDNCTAGACGATTISARNDGILNGWTAGVGIGYAVTKNLHARLEYAYFDFDSVAVSGNSGGNSYNWDQELEFHTLTAGLSIMF